MADITSPNAIKFVNEQIRPIAETIRALKYQIDAIIVDWFAGQNVTISNTADAIEDGRETEGVSRLVGSDVVNVVSQLVAIQSLLNQAGVVNIIAKPCVRTLAIS